MWPQQNLGADIGNNHRDCVRPVQAGDDLTVVNTRVPQAKDRLIRPSLIRCWTVRKLTEFSYEAVYIYSFAVSSEWASSHLLYLMTFKSFSYLSLLSQGGFCVLQQQDAANHKHETGPFAEILLCYLKYPTSGLFSFYFRLYNCEATVPQTLEWMTCITRKRVTQKN